MADPLSPADRWALADLVADYARAVDERDFEALRSVFLRDAELDTGRAVRRGIDEILTAMQGLLRYEATAHHVGTPRVESLTPDRAAGLTYCEAHHLSVDGPQRTDRVMHIRYHDEFVRTDEGWRVATRRLEVSFTDERPVT